MADAAAARREARRRRILDNSQNRLQIISGKCSTESIRDSSSKSPISTCDENPEVPLKADQCHREASTSSNNGVVISEPETSLLALSGDQPFGDTETFEDFSSLASLTNAIPERVQVPQSTFWEKVTKNKYDVVLITLFIHALYHLSVLSFESSYFFLPLVVYSVTKAIFVPKQSNSGIASALLLLNGLSGFSGSNNRIQKMLTVSQWISTFSQDASIYLFTTICLESLINAISKKNFVT